VYSANWELERKVVRDFGGKRKVSYGAEHEVMTERGDGKGGVGRTRKKKKETSDFKIL